MTTDAQERIIKQLEDRYMRISCSPQDDGSLKIKATRGGLGNVIWERSLHVKADGKILSDEEVDIDNYSDFRDDED